MYLNVTNRFFNNNNEKKITIRGRVSFHLKTMWNRRCQSAVTHCYQTVFSTQMKKRNNPNAPGWPTSSSPPCDGCLRPKLTGASRFLCAHRGPPSPHAVPRGTAPAHPLSRSLSWLTDRTSRLQHSSLPPLRFPTNEACGARTSLQRAASRLVGSAGVCAP